VSSSSSRRSPQLCDPKLDWLGEEVDRLADDLGFDRSERLFAALADAFESMCYCELVVRYRAIEGGTARWGICYSCVGGGGLIFEWAGYPLLVSDVELL
jgi:hypothetical protein